MWLTPERNQLTAFLPVRWVGGVAVERLDRKGRAKNYKGFQRGVVDGGFGKVLGFQKANSTLEKPLERSFSLECVFLVDWW